MKTTTTRTENELETLRLRQSQLIRESWRLAAAGLERPESMRAEMLELNIVLGF